MNLAASIFAHRQAEGKRRGAFSMVVLLTLLALLLAPVQYTPVASELKNPGTENELWEYHTLDAPKLFINMTDHSLKFDSKDRPHVVYGGDHLYYSYYDGKNWIHKVVDDSPSVGQYASLALDWFDRPQISYYDAAHGTLKFAYLNQDGWHVVTIDGPSAAFRIAGSVSSTAEGTTTVDATTAVTPTEETVPAETAPAISTPVESAPREWADKGAEAYRTLAPTIKGLNGTGLFTSIVIGEDHRTHISYYDADHGDLKYTTWNGLGWTYVTVDSKDDVGLWTSIALGVDDEPKIAYMSEQYDELKFAECDDHNDGTCTFEDWSLYTIDNGLSSGTEESSNIGPYASLAIDGEDQVHITYYDFTQGDLMYAHRQSENDWNFSVIDAEGDVGGYSSLSIGENDEPCVSYFDFTNEDLKFACSPRWSPQVIDDDGSVGRYSSFAVDSDGQRSISYLDNTTGALRLATDDDDWEFQDIAYTRDVGVSTSLTLSPSGLPYISYMDDMTDDLKAVQGCSSLTPQLVDDINVTGLWSSMEVDSYGNPHIFYYETSNDADDDGDDDEDEDEAGSLKYAYIEPSSGLWVSRVIDRDYDMGRYVSTVIGADNTIHIAYYDATHGDLKYARGRGANWYFQLVDTEGDVGRYPSIALNPSGYPQISYYDVTSTDLKYAYSTPTGVWETQALDRTGDVGLYTSLVVDGNNIPHIAYFDATNSDLKYATFNGTIWVYQTIDSANEVGRYNSIALVNGLPRISYYNMTDADLKFASFDGAAWSTSIVDFAGDVGSFSSMVTNGSGQIYISYYDRTNGDLKMANTPGATISGVCSSQRFIPMVRR